MPSYNATMLQNTTGVLDLFSYANHVTGDMFMVMLIVSMYFILILALKRYDFVQGIWAASFVMFFVSIFATAAGLLNIMIPIFFLTVVAFIALKTYTSDA